MCKCTISSDYQTSVQQSFPYCGKGDCKPTKEWLALSKGCPWMYYKKLYTEEKTPLCRGASTETNTLTHSWSSGNFYKHFCCKENCAPYHFFSNKGGRNEDIK